MRAADSLWAISERLLGDDATDDEIAAAWNLLYSTNRAVLGPDPNVLYPGTRLVVPGDSPLVP